MDKLTPPALRLKNDHIQQIIAHVDQNAPNEACGLIAGSKDGSHAIYAITNILNNPTRFKMDPQEQIAAMIQINEQNLNLQAIYHSHPSGPARPSPTDIREAHFPYTPNLIISYNGTTWEYNAFLYQRDTFHPIPVKLLR